MQKPSGYPTTILQEVDPKFQCVYCNCILKIPIQSYCGHRFCKECIEYTIKHEISKLCPRCIDEGDTSEYSILNMEQTFPDNAIKREFSRMNAICPFENCVWSGLFKDFETHYMTCEHNELECQCGTKYLISRQREHLENECPYREVNCSNCNESTLFKDLDEHCVHCPLRPGRCMICKGTLPPAESPEEAFARHLKNDVAGHLMIAAQRICLLESILGLTCSFWTRQESLNNRLSTIENILRSLSPGQLQRNLVFNSQSMAAPPRGEVREPRDLADLKFGNRSALAVECEIAALRREVEKLKLKMDSMQKQRRQETEQLDALDRRVKSLEGTLAIKDVAILELRHRISALEQTSSEDLMESRDDDFQTSVDNIAGLLKRAAQKIYHLELVIGVTDGPPSPGQESLISRILRIENQTRSLSPGQQQKCVRPTAPEAEARGIPASAYPKVQLFIQSKMETIQQTIEDLSRRVKMLALEVDTMERQRRRGNEQLGALVRKIKSLEREVAMRNAKIADLNLKITDLEQASYHGTLLWRIDNFDRRRQEAVSGQAISFYSPVFYTSKTGYKMRVRLFLNGDENAVGTHISVSLVILRGQYDALLEWPFRGAVTFTLLDQRGEGEGERMHVVHSFDALINPASPSFKRPENQMNVDIGSRCPLFLDLAQLNHNSAAVYIRDNIVFLKIVVCLDHSYNSDDDSIENIQDDDI